MTHRTLPSRAPARAVCILLLALVAGVVAAATVSCGASIQAVYEGDVRFEHCMSLDSSPDVKRATRSACWEEWVKFYTFGQTRDRIEYAHTRQKQLDAASDTEDSAVGSHKPSIIAAVPDPTSVLVPPPMMLAADGGAPDSGPIDGGVADADTSPPPAADCTAECEPNYRACRKECKTAPCEKTCVTKYKRCMKRCF